jgi:hypothetical protein
MLPYLRFQICGQGWPVNGGAMLIPAGTIIDYSIRDTYSEVCWAAQLVPPYDAQALDMTTYNFMQAAYPDHHHLMGPPPTGRHA